MFFSVIACEFAEADEAPASAGAMNPAAARAMAAAIAAAEAIWMR